MQPSPSSTSNDASSLLCHIRGYKYYLVQRCTCKVKLRFKKQTPPKTGPILCCLFQRESFVTFFSPPTNYLKLLCFPGLAMHVTYLSLCARMLFFHIMLIHYACDPFLFLCALTAQRQSLVITLGTVNVRLDLPGLIESMFVLLFCSPALPTAGK